MTKLEVTNRQHSARLPNRARKQQHLVHLGLRLVIKQSVPAPQAAAANSH